MKIEYEETKPQDPIDAYTVMFGPFKGVLHLDARRILGDELFDCMMADKIRCKGPTSDTVYPWNVRAYRTIGEQEASRSGDAAKQ